MVKTIAEVQQECAALANPENVRKYWYHKSFGNDEVEYFKGIKDAKDSAIDQKYRDGHAFDFRVTNGWVGKPGEIAFKSLLTDVYGYTEGIQFKHWESDSDIDRQDFTLSATARVMEIDVKTCAVNAPPRPEYEVNVNAKQYEKIMHPDFPVNTLVFADFILPQNEVIVFGWVSMLDFNRLKVFRRRGSQSGKIIVSQDMYCIKISQLMPFRKVAG